jgi:hypothetical protein
MLKNNNYFKERKTDMKHTMNKIIIVALVAVVGVAGFVVIKKRCCKGMFLGSKKSSPGQILLTNDSSDKISVEYKRDGKDVAAVIEPQQELACGDNGVLRVYVASKAGSYEIVYPVDEQSRSVAISQIVSVAKKDNVAEEILTQKAMIGDLKVMYEEVVSDE